MSEELPETRILVTDDGPYVVYGGVPLRQQDRVLNEEGEPTDWRTTKDWEGGQKYALCRCGQSRNKPFCDGSHREAKWDPTLTADRTPRSTKEEIYVKGDFEMTDDRPLCAGYAFCDLFGSVWDEMESADDPEVRARIERQVMNCPSGRLAVRLKGQKENLEFPIDPMIATVPDGALRVIGDIPLITEDDLQYEVQHRRTLCRCGLSQNKPFCDGTHWTSGFEAP